MDLATDLPTKEEIIAYYNGRLSKSRTTYDKWVHQAFNRLSPSSDKTALVLGSKCGVNAQYLARQGVRVTAVDFADQRIEYAEEKCNNRHLTYICEDVLDLRTNELYEIILATDIITKVDPARIGDFVQTILAHAHSRTLVYLTMPMNYFTAYRASKGDSGILESQIPLALVIAMFDKAGFVPMDIETFGTVAPVEHYEIIFITKMHLNDVWQEIYEPTKPASPSGEVPDGTQEEKK